MAKYDRLGQPAWQRRIGKIQEKLNVGIIADPLGGVSTYTTRASSTAGSDLDVEVIQYDSDGLEKWRNIISSPMDEVATGSSIDNNRNLLVTGFTLGSIENYVAVSSECTITALGSGNQFVLNEDESPSKKLCPKSDPECASATYSVVTTSNNRSNHGYPLHNIEFREGTNWRFINFGLHANQHGADNITITRSSDNCEKTFELIVNRKNDDPLTNSDQNPGWFIDAGDNFTCESANGCLQNVLDSVDAGLVGNNTLSNISSDNWSVSQIENTNSDNTTVFGNNTVVITPNGRWWFQPDIKFNGRQYFSVKVFDNDNHSQDKRICVASVTHQSDNSTPILRCQNQLANTFDNVFVYSINEGDNLTSVIYAHDQNNQRLDFRILEGTDPGYGSIQSGSPTSTLVNGKNCFDGNNNIHLYNCGSTERTDYRPNYQQYEDYGYARIKDPDNQTDNSTQWTYQHSNNPNDYSDYILNDSAHKYYDFKVRFTDQTDFYNDAIIRVTVRAVNDTPVAYDNNTLASEHVEATDTPAPLDVSHVDSNCSDGYCDNWNNTANERNKIMLQGSDIEDTIDNLTFYFNGSSCAKSTCSIVGKSNSSHTTFSERTKRQFKAVPFDNLSYAVYTDQQKIKVRDGGRYGVYNNSGTLTQLNDRKDSARKTISLVLFGLNDQPVADNVTANVSEGIPGPITLSGSDIDRDDKISHFTITQLPDSRYGQLFKTDNSNIVIGDNISAFDNNTASILFVVRDNVSAGSNPVTFKYTATDNSSTTKSDLRQPDQIYNEPKESDNATVQLNIYGANDRPTAGAVSDSVVEDSPKGITLSFSDIDQDDSAFQYTITSLITHGNIHNGGTLLTSSNLPYNLPIGTNSVTITPLQTLAKNQVYSDSFNYMVTDNSSTVVLGQETHESKTSTVNTVSLTINGANDAPVANSANQGNIAYGQATKTFSLTGSDVDGDSISYVLSKSPTYTPVASFNQLNGAVSLSTHSFTIPNIAFRENLVFQVKDVHNALSDNATITFDALGPGCVASTIASPQQTAKKLVNTDAFLTKYDPDGTHLWTRQVGSAGEDVSMGTATDLLGNTFMAGYTQGELTENNSAGGLDAFLVKFSSFGKELWRRQFGLSGDDVVLALTADEEGSVYLTGQTSQTLAGHQSAGGVDLFVAKFDIVGRLQWSQQWGTGGHDLGAEISVDVQGQLNLLGLRVSETQNTEVEYFYTRLDASTGDILWTLPLKTETPDATGLALDYTGNAFLVHPLSPEINSNNRPFSEYRPN
ncbi:MAG: hypothetical protein HN867_08595 [Deltaproteobacteria bacterium]|nr:hypothetical protein [Deltaproteobacteria bacterium]